MEFTEKCTQTCLRLPDGSQDRQDAQRIEALTFTILCTLC
jgi:hypothetical protein